MNNQLVRCALRKPNASFRISFHVQGIVGVVRDWRGPIRHFFRTLPSSSSTSTSRLINPRSYSVDADDGTSDRDYQCNIVYALSILDLQIPKRLCRGSIPADLCARLCATVWLRSNDLPAVASARERVSVVKYNNFIDDPKPEQLFRPSLFASLVGTLAPTQTRSPTMYRFRQKAETGLGVPGLRVKIVGNGPGIWPSIEFEDAVFECIHEAGRPFAIQWETIYRR